MTAITHDPADDDSDRVAKAFACPSCGENRVDYLAWLPNDSEELRCTTCTPGEDPSADTPVSV